MGTGITEYKYNNALLIDDSELDNFINEKMLDSNSFSKSIHVRTDGRSALEFIKGLNKENEAELYPDIVFVDLNMPIMNGFEFIENFKKINDKRVKKSRIIVLTSSIYKEDKERAEKLDSNILFVNKPLTNELLLQL